MKVLVMRWPKSQLHYLQQRIAVATIFAALLAFVSGVFGPWVQYRIGKRQAAAAQRANDAAMLTAQNAGTREIAVMRLAWMDELRDMLSEFHPILMIRDDVDQEKVAQKLSLLGTQIDLLLNQDDKVQKVLWDVTDKLYNSQSREERQSMDEELIRAGRPCSNRSGRK